MPLGPIELGGRTAFVMGFDPEAAGLPPLLSGPVVVVTSDGTVTRDLRDAVEPSARAVSFSEAQLTAEAVAVVHTLWAARTGPILSAIRAGVRTFHLVDAPGSSYKSNARGALFLTLRRAFARLFMHLPIIGRLDVPWPSATATLRALEAAPRPAVATPGSPTRAVHWLPELGPRTEEAVALLEHLVPRTRSLGIAVDVIIPGPADAYNVRARRLERLGASCRFLPRKTWQFQAVRPRLSGLAPELVHDLENHVHADLLLPLLEDLQDERRPRATVVHGWLDPTLTSASVVGLAGKLVGARVILHVAGVSRSREREDLAALSLERLVERTPDLAILTSSAKDLAAWAGLPPERLTEVAQAVVAEPPLPDAERAIRRRLLGVAESALLVVAVGDLDAEAASFLIGVVRRLQGAGVDAQVLHAGHSSAEARLSTRDAGLGPRLRLLGHAPDESEYLRMADAVLRVGTASMKDEDLEGFAFPRGDAAAAADQLVRLARDPDLRRKLAERRYALARERYAPERFVEKVLGLYPVGRPLPVV